MKITRHILTAALLTAGLNCQSQQSYTLQECQKLAIQNNRELKNAQIDMEIANYGRKGAFTGYFPQISATANAFQGFNHLMQADMEMSGVGVIPLSVIKKGVTASLTAVQPVFTGFQIRNGNKLARIQHEVSILNYNLSEKKTQLECEKLYWQIATLKSNQITLEAIARQLQEIHRQVSISVKAGITTRNDLLRVELRQQEIESKKLNLENALHISKMLLAQFIGAEKETFDIVHSEFTNPEDPEKFHTDTQTAVYNREEYRMAEKSTQANRYLVKIERGKNMPSAAIGIGDIFMNITDKNVNNGIVFASVSVPISEWWGGSHNIKQAKLQQIKAQNNQIEAAEQLCIDIEKSWSDLLEAYSQIEISQRSVKSATENLRLNNEYFKAGTTSLTDLLDAESLYIESNNRQTISRSNYQYRISEYLQKTR